MFGKLVLIFIITPLIELFLLIEIGQQIGVLATVLIVIFTGIAGAALTQRQGFQIIFQIRNQIQSGQFPADSLLEGGIILIGGLTLLTPGFITDAIGFCCLIPPTRKFLSRIIKKVMVEKLRVSIDPDRAIKTDFSVENDEHEL